MFFALMARIIGNSLMCYSYLKVLLSLPPHVGEREKGGELSEGGCSKEVGKSSKINVV